MRKALKRALISLGLLCALAFVVVLLVANGLALWKEFVSVIGSGIVAVISVVIAGQSKDEAKSARTEAESVRVEVQKRTRS